MLKSTPNTYRDPRGEMERQIQIFKQQSQMDANCTHRNGQPYFSRERDSVRYVNNYNNYMQLRARSTIKPYKATGATERRV